VILVQTERIRVFHDVANLPLRPPAAFAKAVRFDGRQYRLEGARLGPKPVHQIGIWLGAAKPRALALTGRVADGWAAPLMNYMPPAAAVEAQTIIDRAAREAGRDPGEIRRIYIVPGASTAAAPAPARDTDQAIVGPPDHWAAVLTHFALDLGLGTFLLLAPPDPDMLRTFIEDVAPQVRERVAMARG
jgi:alkanesulfonate monooxygenase SsuD/methylene tetrahydromethanopterin reductase-like flavin-dependent oxidoreductase (luciferase family)